MSCEVGIFVLSCNITLIVDAQGLCLAVETIRNCKGCHVAALVPYKTPGKTAPVVPHDRALVVDAEDKGPDTMDGIERGDRAVLRWEPDTTHQVG
jgi:hypothetical protein